MSAPKRDPYTSHIPTATAALLPPELPLAERRSRECQSKVLDGCWYGLTTCPWTKWTKDLQKKVVDVCSYHQESIPYAKFVAVCLSGDHRTRGG